MTALMGQVYVAMSYFAAWDIERFLKNSKNYMEVIFIALVALMGMIALGWGVVILVLRLLGDPQEAKRKYTWGRIGLLILVGGALIAAAGWQAIKKISESGAGTIDRLGTGSIDILGSGGIEVLNSIPWV